MLNSDLTTKYGAIPVLSAPTVKSVNPLSKYGATLVSTNTVTPSINNPLAKYGATPIIPTQTQVSTNLFPNTTQSWQSITVDPLNLKANPMQAIGDAWNTIKDSVAQEGQRINELFQSKSLSQGVGGALRAGVGLVNIGYSPISALFSAANDIPVLGAASKLISTALSAGGEVGSNLAGTIVDNLPIPQQDRDNIKLGVQEVGALASQIGMLKVAHVIAKPYLPAEIKAKTFKEDFTTKYPEYSEDVKKLPTKMVNDTLKNRTPEEASTLIKQAIDVNRLQKASIEEPIKPSADIIKTTTTTTPIEVKPVEITPTEQPIQPIISSKPAPDVKLGGTVTSEAKVPVEPQYAVNRTSFDIIKSAVKKEIIKSEDIKTHEVQNVDMWIERGIQTIMKNPMDAVKMAMGEINAPEGTTASTIFRLLEKRAMESKNIEAILKLNESLLGVKMGREVKGFDIFNELSPTDRIREIRKSVEKNVVESKTKTTALVKEMKQFTKLSKETLSTKLSKYIDEMTC